MDSNDLACELNRLSTWKTDLTKTKNEMLNLGQECLSDHIKSIIDDLEFQIIEILKHGAIVEKK